MDRSTVLINKESICKMRQQDAVTQAKGLDNSGHGRQLHMDVYHPSSFTLVKYFLLETEAIRRMCSALKVSRLHATFVRSFRPPPLR